MSDENEDMEAAASWFAGNDGHLGPFKSWKKTKKKKKTVKKKKTKTNEETVNRIKNRRG